MNLNSEVSIGSSYQADIAWADGRTKRRKCLIGCVKSKLRLVKFQIDLIRNINNNNKNLAHAQLVVWTGNNKNVDLKLHSTVHWSSSCSEQEFSILHSTGHPIKYILQNK